MPNYEDFKRYGELTQQGRDQDTQPAAPQAKRDSWWSRLVASLRPGGKG